MDKHKKKAANDGCLCENCPHKFVCFTQERIFSDPLYQGLFEALMAKGRTKEEALEEVTHELKLVMTRREDKPSGLSDITISPWVSEFVIFDVLRCSHCWNFNWSWILDI